MTADIIPLQRDTWHIAGKAKCLVCGTEWIAAAPVGTAYLECPQCRIPQGVMRAPIGGDADQGEQEWACSCGCDVFKIVARKTGQFKGVLCMRCGKTQDFS